MPVWQGQGYNSGMRDAFNLALESRIGCEGNAGPELLRHLPSRT